MYVFRSSLNDFLHIIFFYMILTKYTCLLMTSATVMENSQSLHQSYHFHSNGSGKSSNPPPPPPTLVSVERSTHAPRSGMLPDPVQHYPRRHDGLGIIIILTITCNCSYCCYYYILLQ